MRKFVPTILSSFFILYLKFPKSDGRKRAIVDSPNLIKFMAALMLPSAKKKEKKKTKKKSLQKWYFVTKIVLTYCEKKLF